MDDNKEETTTEPEPTEATSMFGDCDNCGHSFMYHVPLSGCVKCSCDEFH